MKDEENGITETITIDVTPIEDDLLDAFRKLSDEAKEKVLTLIQIMGDNK